MPDPKRINPISGAKNIFGPNAAFEAFKSISKVGIVGAVDLRVRRAEGHAARGDGRGRRRASWPPA